ncbi:MAG: hypothetical protein ABI779_22640 [Acidobacteriota bacterium]
MVIGTLTLLRIAKGAGGPPYGVDASYYYQLARHVMRGDGLVTSVSLYHEGWIVPARTAIYPLWPLLLGYSGRFLGLERAADLLPRIFYVLDLVLLYFLARGVALRLGGLRITDRWYVPDSAHWIVAIFALAPRLFGATTHPYTEGLAFALGFASFLTLGRFERTRSWIPAALSGLFAGLAFLARTQMVGVAIGCFLAMAWYAWRERGMRRGALAWSAVALATVTPWFLFLGFIPGVTPDRLPRATLPKFAGWTELPTRWDWLAQRAGSLQVMFDPWNQYSYVQSFGVVAFLVPLAAIVALAELVRRRRTFGESGESGDSVGAEPGLPRLLIVAMLLAGLFFFFNLMLYHSEVWMPWLFGWRHGLPFLFLLMLAVPWLVGRSGRFAGAIALVLLVSVAVNARNVVAFIRSPDPQLTTAETALVHWLDGRPGKVAVMTTNAQILASKSDASFYWTHCQASGDMTRAMFRAQPIDYVVLYEREMQCPFVREAGKLKLVAGFGEPGRRVFVLQPLR